jgi:class 3 adenylate cyclase
MEPPDTRYARCGAHNVAYQVAGEGEVDLVFVQSFLSNLELAWTVPGMADFLAGLTAFSRLIAFDRRGTGMSDGTAAPATLEDQLDDVRAVLDAAGSHQPVLLSFTEGAALALLFAATHPERVRALVLITPQARLVSGHGYEWALPAPARDAFVEASVEHWGRAEDANPFMGFFGDDPDERHLAARYQRLVMGPGDAEAVMALAGQIDVRDVLGSVQCPALVLRRVEDELLDERHSRYVAERVPGARYLELPGDGPVWGHGSEDALGEIQEFLTGVRPPATSERVLATVLFTDIVGSTERAAELGDARWRQLLERHDALVRGEVQRYRGRVVKSLGDGAMALFDGPSRALAAALAIRDGVGALGVQVRAGLHTGECELLGEDIGGMAVHIAARIAALAAPEQVLASGTVRDLTVGSPYELSACGERRLKGIAEPWRVFAVGR